MRILIAEDNIALQEVLSEVISNAGHTVQAIQSSEGALSEIHSFNPDAIFLDMDNGYGLELLDRMQSSIPIIDKPVIIIRNWGKQIPQDNVMIFGNIEKPFYRSDIIDIIDKIKIEDVAENELPKVIKEPIHVNETLSEVTLADKGLSFGESYILFQNNAEEIHRIISMFDNEGSDVLLVTTNKKKAIIERFKNNEIRAMILTIKLLSGHMNKYGLGTMIDDVIDFIDVTERPVVAFDDLNKIIDRNGMNSAITAIHQLITGKYEKDVTFIISVDPKGFTVKDKEILLNHMKYYDITGE